MGLIKAITGAVGGVLADQWKEYFYCDSISDDILAVKGQKRTSGRSSNRRGSDNIISSGSVVAVADGQCMLIVEQGKIVDVCAEPGEFVYDASTEPSIFSGDLGEGIGQAFASVGQRFTFGGQASKDQRVYYFNTKEIPGNKYGTPSPLIFRVVDERARIDMDIPLRCFGEYSFRLSNPLLFYTQVCGNVSNEYSRDQLAGQMRSELLTALQPSIGKLSAQGIRYSELMTHTTAIRDALQEELSSLWLKGRGIEIVNFGISSIKTDEDVEETLRQMQREASYMDPARMAARLGNAQAEAMQAAASNTTAGPAMAFMGMNMAGQAGSNLQGLYAQGQQQAASQAMPPVTSGWTCECGHAGNMGKFCSECGKPRPAPAAPAASWTCECGTINHGKFCCECGKPRPAAAPRYKCSTCGWQPADATKPPKFCPECGSPFNEEDLI